MDELDYSEPELYDRRDVLLLWKRTRVENARRELDRFGRKLFVSQSIRQLEVKNLKSELVIRLAELHIAETKAE